MKNRIICNLRSGGFGLGSIYNRRPVAYLGQSGTWEFLFEDISDAYASSIRNVDKDSAIITVRVGPRGGSDIMTVSNGSFTNLTSTCSVSGSYNNHKLTFEFNRSPLDGFFTLNVGATATLAVATEYPTGAAVPALAAYPAHTALRNTTSGKIPYDAGEAEIEDHVRAMFNEMVAGAAGSYASAGISTSGAPAGVSTEAQWAGYVFSRGIIEPQITASIIDDLKIGVQLYVPDFALDVPFVFASAGLDTSGVPSGGPADGGWSTVIVPTKGSMVIDSMSASGSGLVGPKGKFATLDFGGANLSAFTSALGSANEVALWMEVDLDGETVCDGEILLKKPMS